MKSTCRITIILMFALCIVGGSAYAQEAEPGPIPVGTVITLQNWRQYKQYMPHGMQELFKGDYQWKIPSDFKMVVGPTHHYALPPTFEEYTKKYSHLVGINTLPNGRHILTGYVAGLPFPDPAPPMKGWKILVDLWYTYTPTIFCTPHAWLYFLDRYHNRSSESFIEVYRRLEHIGDAGYPIKNPRSQGVQYAEYLEIMTPEQARYTAQLTLYYSDFNKDEDLFLFIPSLRRTLRLSSAARCSPVVGSDYTQDDAANTLFNSTPARFDAKYLGDQPVLAVTKSEASLYGNYNNYYPTILLPKPIVGEWEVRNSRIIDVRRIPSERKGYCYGKRIIYIDAENYMTIWEDLYDANMKLWKVAMEGSVAGPVAGQGFVLNSRQEFNVMYDLQNTHLSFFNSGYPANKVNEGCKNYDGQDFTNITRYSSVQGLALIMR